jgi:6-phosphogluconolactonase
LNRIVKIFRTPEELAEAFASDLVNRINNSGKKKNPFTIALSGGNTPKLLFEILADKYRESIDWSNVHLFWVDERCVPPADPESNYGMTRQILLSKIIIPENNIHRIRGEEEPEKEASRYSEEIKAYTPTRDKFPLFDLIILGMGDDGHTASIFPGNLKLLSSDRVCEAAAHPVSGQKRVTITGKVINNAWEVVFIVTGSGKAPVIGRIFNKDAESVNFPAAYVVPFHGNLSWLLDEKAGEFIR